jgi:hypothetical protein
LLKKTLAKNDIFSVYLFVEDSQYIVGKVYSRMSVQKEDYANVLQQQVEVIESVNHPFIPKYHQVLRDKNFTVLFQDFVSGQSLY